MKKKAVTACWSLLASLVADYAFAQAGEGNVLLTFHNVAFFLVGLFLAAGVYYKQFLMRRKSKTKGRVHHDASDD
ncbi:hypothetical protein [Marinomonas pollencensis]|uniref:Uncharacterized protein n=1 Tax=Marinomonas pollencensis TaxID=491954 RepID=A0A3E0DF52_9GAMM|nr:hypothetical protein [Marinomonas pollencensis]REG81336.1 hypothetical protein DFP81_11557 [Marinomonas pollencensis]